MFSFTSNSKSEARVVLMVLMVLAGCELGLRVVEKRVSVDARTPAISKRLASAEGQRVLVLGNSLVRDNVNTDVLGEEFRAQGARPIQIERVYLLNTVINDWYYAFKHHFIDTGQAPDVLILCFAGNHLEDYPIRRTVVARYNSSARDIPEIFSNDVKDFDGRADFLLSSWSASFAYRTNVQRRILNSFVPNYLETVTRINEGLKGEVMLSNNAPGDEATSQPAHIPNYDRFGKFLRMAASKGVSVILVAVPTKSSYPIYPELSSTLEAAGGSLIDTRIVDGLSKDSYEDELHLTADGATLYSRFLAHQLAGYFKTASPRGPGVR